MNRYPILLLLLIVSQNSYGQLAYPYKVYSENKLYFVKSVPFSDQVWTVLGKTSVYRVDDTTSAVAVIDRYFSPDYLFLANDGQSFFYLDNWIDPSTTDESEILTFYQQDKPIQNYKLRDFQLADSMRIHSILYNSYNDRGKKLRFPKVNRSNNYFQTGDVLTLFVHGEGVYQFSMLDGKLTRTQSFEKFFRENKIHETSRKVVKFDIKIPTQYGVPKLANGKEFWEELETALDVVFFAGDNEDYERKYKHYTFEINCAIDSTGKCIDATVETKDSTYKDDIIRFFKSAQFDKKEIPRGIEKWYFHYITGFRSKSKSIAEGERKQEIEQEKVEYQERIKQDSIDHIYIPANIEDCFKQLDKLLKHTERREFAAKREAEAIGLYHMGLGLWMRSNWGLWSGSRLSHYFNELGVTHPDDVSSVIITSYHRHLNGKDIKLEEQLNR